MSEREKRAPNPIEATLERTPLVQPVLWVLFGGEEVRRAEDVRLDVRAFEQLRQLALDAALSGSVVYDGIYRTKIRRRGLCATLRAIARH